MARFDPERKRIVIRVVYDGPGHAGKTTNLQRLSKSFASWRRSDLVSPNTLGERTQYFDWLEVDVQFHRQTCNAFLDRVQIRLPAAQTAHQVTA